MISLVVFLESLVSNSIVQPQFLKGRFFVLSEVGERVL